MTPSEPTASPASEEPGPEKHSPLEDSHLALGAKMVGFGGWLMPLSYPGGTIAEHQACRTDSVVFDVSHLGTVRVDGAGAFDRLQSALSNDLRKVGPGRAQYTHLLDDADGSVVDDIIIWWLGEELFDVMPNASNTTSVVRRRVPSWPPSAIGRPGSRDSGLHISTGPDASAPSPVPVTQGRTGSSARSPSLQPPRSSKP